MKILLALLLIAGEFQMTGLTKPFTQWSMGTDVFRYAGNGWVLMGTFGHENYFEHMGVRTNVDETKYIKNGKEVYNFPDQTDVTLDLETVTCAPDKAQNKAAEAVSPEQVIDNVEFKVEWKRKEYLRPAKIIMYKLNRQPMSPTGRLLIDRKYWRASITVESVDVPLGDHIIVSMFNKDGLRVARISGQVGH